MQLVHKQLLIFFIPILLIIYALIINMVSTMDWFGRLQKDISCGAHWQCSSSDGLVCRTTIQNPNLTCQVDNCNAEQRPEIEAVRISSFDISFYQDGCTHRFNKKNI